MPTDNLCASLCRLGTQCRTETEAASRIAADRLTWPYLWSLVRQMSAT